MPMDPPLGLEPTKWVQMITVLGTSLADYHGVDRDSYMHIFLDGFCAAEVILERAKRCDSTEELVLYVLSKIAELRSDVCTLKSRKPYEGN